MKKVLLVLLGLILLALLSFFCFQNKADTIRDTLVASTNSALSAHNITGVTANLKGYNHEMTDIMQLTGEVQNTETKVFAETLARGIDGVGDVDNQLRVANETPALVAKVNASKDAPAKIDPYTLTITKNKNGKITIDGYLDSEQTKKAFIEKANEIFGSKNVNDNTEVLAGAPEDWEYISAFALECLKDVDYGDMKLHNQSYEFTAHLPSPSTKANFLDGIRTVMSNPENKYGRYRGDYIITAPVEEPVAVATKKVDTNTTQKEAKADNNKTTPATPKSNKAIMVCQASLDAVLKDKKVLFDYNKARIKKDSYSLLNEVLAAAQKCHVTQLIVEGHTDNVGTKSYNKTLSNIRAANVKKYFVKKGFPLKNIKALGFGATKPVAPNKTAEGRAKNRRIEFIVKGVK